MNRPTLAGSEPRTCALQPFSSGLEVRPSMITRSPVLNLAASTDAAVLAGACAPSASLGQVGAILGAPGVSSSRLALRMLRSLPASVRMVSHAPLRATISPQVPSESCTREPTLISPSPACSCHGRMTFAVYGPARCCGGAATASGAAFACSSTAASGAAIACGAASISGAISLTSALRILRSSPASVRIVSHAPLRATSSPQMPSESCTREPMPIPAPTSPGADSSGCFKRWC
mmetsp:Transcript_10615/g.25296  ORF Transcript_10615/g.25296 Transcript_10615/m.25296 type:complete len:234 (-) Transcript_10615:535-1236(-)